MNINKLKDSLIQHEGNKPKPYTCSAGKLTIGIGHNLDNPLSPKAIDQIFVDDVDTAIEELNRAFPSWTDHNNTRQNVLIEMMFNLGAPTLSQFKKMWSALASKNYVKASIEMLDSKWAKQVHKRAETLSEMMATGEF